MLSSNSDAYIKGKIREFCENPRDSFSNLGEFLARFLRELPNLFHPEDGFSMANLRCYSEAPSLLNSVENGWLKNTQVIYNLDDLSDRDFKKRIAEVMTFFGANSVVSESYEDVFRVTKSIISNKVIFEAIHTYETRIPTNPVEIREYSNDYRILTVYFPQLYDPQISERFFGKIKFKAKELIVKRFRAQAGTIGIIDDGKFLHYLQIGLRLSTGNDLRKWASQFLHSKDVVAYIRECLPQFLKCLEKLQLYRKGAIRDFCIKHLHTGCIHSCVKTRVNSYMIPFAGFETAANPDQNSLFLLLNSHHRLSFEKLKDTYYALTVLFSGIGKMLTDPQSAKKRTRRNAKKTKNNNVKPWRKIIAEYCEKMKEARKIQSLKKRVYVKAEDIRNQAAFQKPRTLGMFTLHRLRGIKDTDLEIEEVLSYRLFLCMLTFEYAGQLHKVEQYCGYPPRDGRKLTNPGDWLHMRNDSFKWITTQRLDLPLGTFRNRGVGITRIEEEMLRDYCRKRDITYKFPIDYYM